MIFIGVRDITPLKESRMERTMEYGMETGREIADLGVARTGRARDRLGVTRELCGLYLGFYS